MTPTPYDEHEEENEPVAEEQDERSAVDEVEVHVPEELTRYAEAARAARAM